MNAEHSFTVSVEWQGNRGTGTSGYRDFSRAVEARAEGRHAIQASAAKTFHGDAERWNPEEQLIGALSQCHLLSYLHVATQAGLVVPSYLDAATRTLPTKPAGRGAPGGGGEGGHLAQEVGGAGDGTPEDNPRRRGGARGVLPPPRRHDLGGSPATPSRPPRRRNPPLLHRELRQLPGAARAAGPASGRR